MQMRFNPWSGNLIAKQEIHFSIPAWEIYGQRSMAGLVHGFQELDMIYDLKPPWSASI